MPVIAAIVAAFIIGAVPFGYLVARAYGIQDIRQHGSGNIGATNVYRVVGGKAAAWVFTADIGKGVVAVLLARYIASLFALPWVSNELFFVLCAIAAILGHIFTPFLGFKGGKGVNTALGTMACLLPLECLMALVMFALIFFAFRIVSLASILATCSLFFILLAEAKLLDRPVPTVYYDVAAVLAALILFTHRSNIVRLLSGKEKRITFRSRL